MDEHRAGLPERIGRDIGRDVGRVASRPLNRRAFVAVGLASAIGATLVGARPAAADAETVVYRLNADWGYPVGPKGKTRCSCRACFRRAENAFFETRAAAIAGRVHPCCVCRPYRTVVAGVTSAELFRAGDAADLRDPMIAAMFAPIATPMGEPNAAPLEGTPAPAAAGAGASAMPAGPLGFARTGSTLRLPIIGGAMAAAGGALIAFRNRQSGSTSTPGEVDNQGEPT